MRTVQLVQVTKLDDLNLQRGYEPELNNLYKVRDLQDDYYFEEESDDGDETYETSLSSISINVVGMRRVQHIIKGDDTEYSVLTIELDETSELFK